MKFPKKCPLCNKSQKKFIKVAPYVYGDKSKKRSFFLCQNCDVRFLYPILKKAEEKYFYKKEFENFMDKRAGKTSGWLKAEDHIKKNHNTYSRRFKYIQPYLKKKQNILEIGCSSGFMLFPLTKKGHACTGVEPSGVFYNFLKEKKMNVYNSLESLKKNKKIKYDLIIHFFVLEHIADPINFLKELLSLLKKNGKIIFEIPNVADPLHSMYDIPSFEKFYWSIAHHWYFSFKSLSYVFNKINHSYKIKLDQRYDLSNHLYWSKYKKPGGMGKYSNLIGKNIDTSYKKILIKNGLCDTLIGVVSK